MSEVKEFKTIDQQIEILRARGLIFNDIEFAKKTLSHINYYRLSGYALTLIKDNKFYEGITFENMIEINNFDAECRSAILQVLEYIEVSFRTQIGYFHSKEYGATGYLDKNTFKDERHYNVFINEFNKIIRAGNRNEVFIKHHLDNYDGKFPFWVVVELLSFGMLSRVFKNLDAKIKIEIANQHYKPIPYHYLENWLQGLVDLRNICAHRGRLYNRYLPFSTDLSRTDKLLFSELYSGDTKINKRIFTKIYVMKKIINNQVVWDDFIAKLKDIFTKYPFVKIINVGFPDNWEELLK